MYNIENGFVRIAVATPKMVVADITENCKQILNYISKAANDKASILLFPELAISGYTCGDLFFQDRLQQQTLDALMQIVEASCDKNMIISVGAPLIIEQNLYNTAVTIANGKILGITIKSFLPNYNEFYEKRWFAPAIQLTTREVNILNTIVPVGNDIIFDCGKAKIGIEICEDLWTPIPPSSMLSLAGADVILNLSASNETVSKSAYRRQLVSQQSARCMAIYAYCSAGNGESTSDIVFGAHNIICENGHILAENNCITDENYIVCDADVERIRKDRVHTGSFSDCNYQYGIETRTIKCDISFTNDNLVYKVDRKPFVPKDKKLAKERCNEIMSIQVAGLKKRLLHTRCKSAVIGISGGLDSTLALLVSVKAFDELGYDRKNIWGITMPGFGTTGRTFDNSIGLMNSLGINSKTIRIKDACLQHFKDIEHDENIHDITYENTQARERTQILMDLANKYNGIVIGTGDLSELALGWCTYNGDHISHYGVNGGVPKTLVKYLVGAYASFHDAKTAEILNDVMNTPISPELLPKGDNDEILQKTEDTVGPYELHDFFLYYMLRFGFEPTKIEGLAQMAFSSKENEDDIIYDKETIHKWLTTCYRRFFSQQFKRNCLPDGPKIGSIALSPRGDWRMPSDASAKIWLDSLS